MPDYQLDHRIAGAAINKRAARCRRQFVDQHPWERYRGEHRAGGAEMRESRGPSRGGTEQVQQRHYRHDAERDEHLGIEANPDRSGAEQ